MCIRCKAPHLGKRSTLDYKFSHPAISPGLQTDLLDELYLAGLKNKLELTKSIENTAEDLSYETFGFKPSGLSGNYASNSNRDESGILNSNFDRNSSTSLDLKPNSVSRLLTRIIKGVLHSHMNSYSTDEGGIIDFPESRVQKPRKESSMKRNSLLKPKNPCDKHPMINPVFLSHLDTDKRKDKQKANKSETNRGHFSKSTIDFLRNLIIFQRRGTIQQ